MKTVGIIGGLDFLGCDITLKFISENYRVKVLVPPLTSHKKPIIVTGLKAGENLQIYNFHLNNSIQLEKFAEDCDCMVHCGIPYELKVNSVQGSVYVPVVLDTAPLIKAIRKSSSVRKIIFLTSVAVYNFPGQEIFSGPVKKRNSATAVNNHNSERAFYHSGKIMHNTLEDFSQDRLKIIVVSPVLVNGNLLSNSSETTLAGLQYLFHNKIEHDSFFLNLVRKNLLETMINVNELPDKVFNKIQFQEKVHFSSES